MEAAVVQRDLPTNLISGAVSAQADNRWSGLCPITSIRSSLAPSAAGVLLDADTVVLDSEDGLGLFRGAAPGDPSPEVGELHPISVARTRPPTTLPPTRRA